MQRYSIENQMRSIASFAADRGYQVVRTYVDHGKSGLTLQQRPGLSKFLSDVQGGRADYAALLVLDVSRWGRFQDPDESAYYEYICRRAGMQVIYCGEPFDNDGSAADNIIKSLKRAMAGEYSRELSRKVSQARERLVKAGYRQGGVAGYGLRRMLIDASGEQKQVLEFGERKWIASDRVVLVPGPEVEVAVVRWIYHLFLNVKPSEEDVARRLNAASFKTHMGKDWDRQAVRQVLTNEKYIGTNVHGRMCHYLGRTLYERPPSEWIRVENAFQGVIDREAFDQVAKILRTRREEPSPEDLLAELRQRHHASDVKHRVDLDSGPTSISMRMIRRHFGGLKPVYEALGVEPKKDLSYVDHNRALKAMTPCIANRVIDALGEACILAVFDPGQNLLRLNDVLDLKLRIGRQPPRYASLRVIRQHYPTDPEFSLVVCMSPSNDDVQSYRVMRREELPQKRPLYVKAEGLPLCGLVPTLADLVREAEGNSMESARQSFRRVFGSKPTIEYAGS